MGGSPACRWWTLCAARGQGRAGAPSPARARSPARSPRTCTGMQMSSPARPLGEPSSLPRAWKIPRAGAQHASGGAAPPRRQVSNVGCEGGGVPKPSARNESTRLQSTSAEVFQSPLRGIQSTSVDSQFDFRRQDSGGAPASARPLCSRAARFRGRERASVRGRSRKKRQS